MRKRLLCIFLLLLLCLLTLPAAADTGQAETEPPAIRLAVEAASPDGTVSVSVYLDKNPGLTSLKLKIGYDASLLTLVSAESTALIGDWFEAGEFVETNPYALVWVCTDVTTATGAVATLKLARPESTTVKETDITIAYSEVFSEGVLLNADVEGCTVYLQCDHIYGGWEQADEEQHVRRCTRCLHSEYQSHAWEAGEILKEPTHVTPGERRYGCFCGAFKTDSVPPTPEHTYTLYPHDDQLHIAKCKCGDETLAPHEWHESAVIQDPTHTAAGFRECICECGETKKEEIPPLPDHEYHASGFDEHQHYAECSCGSTLVEPHVWDEGKLIKEPTANESGILRLTCSCGAERDELLPPTGTPDESDKPPLPGESKPVESEPVESEPGGSAPGGSGGCASSLCSLVPIFALILTATMLGRKREHD